MAGLSKVGAAAKAKKCLDKGTPIPGHPLYNMAAVALWDSKSDFELLQHAIDYLTCKAKAKMQFTDEEKEFLVDLMEDIALGGSVKGYSEAAKLIRHYVNGNGTKLQIGASVYVSSVIVKDTCEAIKSYVGRQIKKKAGFNLVRSSDHGFLSSPEAARISSRSGRDVNRQGYLLRDGYLLTEQSNQRLKNANNRFILAATNSFQKKTVATCWSVNDTYAFEPFERADYVTNIPLSSSMVLKLPDGLSYYMTVLNIAKAFDHWANWTEGWNA